MLRILSLALLPALAASSACPNNCNNHGSCGTSNMCECYRNWFGADCSQRVCSYGYSFIDSPVGDLDGDLKISPSRSFDPRRNNHVVGIQNVIGGQSELFDHNYGYARANQTIPWNEAHFYRECSNKGVCNRANGLCACFPGYEGEGCARLSCPNKCSGHGTCRTIEDSKINADYSAWDLKKTQMCVCDSGYEGPDCSLRSCSRGADPVKYAHYVTNSVQGVIFKASSTKNVFGSIYYTITATDEFGDKWTTRLMTVEYNADGEPVIANAAALKAKVENFNTSLSYNDGFDAPYVWGVHGANTYPSINQTTNIAGSTVFVDSQRFRLDAGISSAVSGICGSGKKGLCYFVQNQNQGIQTAYRVDFWHHQRQVAVKENQVDGQTIGFTSGSSFFSSDATANQDLVSVINVQGNRQWLIKDGDVTKTFMTDLATSLDVCSNRGLCDYTTGLCGCFAGYTGLACSDQNSIAYTY